MKINARGEGLAPKLTRFFCMAPRAVARQICAMSEEKICAPLEKKIKFKTLNYRNTEILLNIFSMNKLEFLLGFKKN